MANNYNIYEIFNVLNFDTIISIIEKPIPFKKVSNKYIELKECYLGRPLTKDDNFDSKQMFLDTRNQLSAVCNQIDSQNEMFFVYNLFKIFISQKGYKNHFDELDFLSPDMYFNVEFKNIDNREYICLKITEKGRGHLYHSQNLFKQLFEIKSIPMDDIQI